jgi:hypothetical protein
MTAILVILIVIVAIVVIAGFAFAPMLRKRTDAAVDRCKELLGGESAVNILESRANGFGTEPSDAGGLRGPGCLGLSDTTIAFVTVAPQNEFQIDRSKVTKVTTSADDLTGVQKAMVMVSYTDNGGNEVTASWRLPDLVDWLTALGYDFGPDGPPTPQTHDEDDD